MLGVTKIKMTQTSEKVFVFDKYINKNYFLTFTTDTFFRRSGGFSNY